MYFKPTLDVVAIDGVGAPHPNEKDIGGSMLDDEVGVIARPINFMRPNWEK